MALWKDGAFADDPWRAAMAGDDANPPLAGGVIVSLSEWKAFRDQAGDNLLLGVRIETGEAIDDIVPDLSRLALVVLAFPKFNDGRSFSKARMLRRIHGYKGEVRAVGEVLWDQLQLMARCGFDAFEITNEPTLKALRAGKKPVMTDFYQPGEGPETRQGAPRAWARRALA
jgi:phosphoadenosine phosphosulfate reductase